MKCETDPTIFFTSSSSKKQNCIEDNQPFLTYESWQQFYFPAVYYSS